MSKLRLLLVRRWLHLLPSEEIETELLRRSIDKAYVKIRDKMVKLYFGDF